MEILPEISPWPLVVDIFNFNKNHPTTSSTSIPRFYFDILPPFRINLHLWAPSPPPQEEFRKIAQLRTRNVVYTCPMPTKTIHFYEFRKKYIFGLNWSM